MTSRRHMFLLVVVAALTLSGCGVIELFEEDVISGAANADVEFVRVVESSDGLWTFHVTVRHPDTGWEDYADGWDVVLPDGTVVKPDPNSPFTRLLTHPHETEQPFTRSLSGIEIPAGLTTVIVRARCTQHGLGTVVVEVDLTVESGEHFEVVTPATSQ